MILKIDGLCFLDLLRYLYKNMQKENWNVSVFEKIKIKEIFDP